MPSGTRLVCHTFTLFTILAPPLPHPPPFPNIQPPIFFSSRLRFLSFLTSRHLSRARKLTRPLGKAANCGGVAVLRS